METTSEWRCSGITCMLLLPQLTKIWLPNDNPARPEIASKPLSEQAPRSQIPPLISFLEGMSDVPTLDEAKGKRLPCGHVVSLRSLLACCNILGDAIWTPRPHFMGCAQPECNESLEFPKLPDPRVVDGLEARLDLIQWSWNKDAPTAIDINKVSVLRDILSRIGHLNRDPEPEMAVDLPHGESNPSSLTQTLVHMELEAYALMADTRAKRAEIPSRGTQPYCTYRSYVEPTAGHSRLRYPMLSPGQHCECVTPHAFQREAQTWALTPAETELHPDKAKVEKVKKRKTVRFVAPVVTEVQYFEPWWRDEYRDSGRYWSTGPHRGSVDFSTPADDDWEIERLDHPEGLAAQIVGELEGGEESDCCTAVDDDDDNNNEDGNDDLFPDGIERADETWDDELLGAIERANEAWDDETLDDLMKLHESWEDRF